MTAAPAVDGGSAPVRLVLAHGRAAVREGVGMLLEAEVGIVVVAEAADLATARRLVRDHRPDVLVLDLGVPGGPALAAIPELARETAVVVLTLHEHPAFAHRALQAGALGALLTEAADAELADAVRSAAVRAAAGG